MNSLSKILLLGTLGAAVILPLAVSWRGFGFATEKDVDLIAAVQSKQCTGINRDLHGNCRRSFRNRYRRRNYRGGSRGFGK